MIDFYLSNNEPNARLIKARGGNGSMMSKHLKPVICLFECIYGTLDYWLIGMSTIELSKKMNISQTTASQSVVRGQKIARAEKLAFLE